MPPSEKRSHHWRLLIKLGERLSLFSTARRFSRTPTLGANGYQTQLSEINSSGVNCHEQKNKPSSVFSAQVWSPSPPPRAHYTATEKRRVKIDFLNSANSTISATKIWNKKHGTDDWKAARWCKNSSPPFASTNILLSWWWRCVHCIFPSPFRRVEWAAL